ncbi:MAG: Fic/DOC family protein [Ktedonobacterales bacterium]
MTAPDGGNLYEYFNGVLRNKFGIQDATELDAVEATLTGVRIIQLERAHPISGHFDLVHLQSIHHFIFQDIYTWAGELRQTDIIKGASRFAHFRFLESSAQKLFTDLAAEHYLRGLPMDQFAVRAAYHLGELNALHPFREGNGRAQRLFLAALATAAGYDLAWERVTADQMIEASSRSLLAAENSGLEAIFHDIIAPL